MNEMKKLQNVVKIALPLPFGIFTIVNIIRCCTNNQWTVETMVFAGLFALTMAVAALMHFEGEIGPALIIATAIILLTLCAYMLSNYFQNGVFLTPLV